MVKIPGWTKIPNMGTIYKWRRDRDNSFLEVSASSAYGYRGGYVVVLWTRQLPKPIGIAGAETKKEAYNKAIEYMQKNP